MASNDEIDVGGHVFWVCPICAAVVEERTRHHKWHRDRGDAQHETALLDQFAPYVD